MDVLFILVPLSVVLVMAILGVFAWALRNGQLDDLEREGLRILHDDGKVPGARADAAADTGRVDGDQVARQGTGEQSLTN
jgi:cbb3-type cytochrome oxidase maturation protein